MDPIDHARRFGGLARLYGPAALEHFGRAHVCVVGIGGVGSWVVEALARSAVGELTLIDLDHVAESNINRQAHATEATLGQAKVIAMAERIAGINPACRVHQVEEFVEPDNVTALLGTGRFDYVIDAVDSVKAKVALVLFCRQHGIPLLTIGAAGGQRDPTRVRVVDLAHTQHEPLLARVRKKLRTQHGYPRNIKTRFGVDAVYSDEPLVYPEGECAVDGGVGTDEGAAADSAADPGGITGLNCSGFGSVVAVTGVFGFVAAAHVLRALAQPGVAALAPARPAMPAKAAEPATVGSFASVATVASSPARTEPAPAREAALSVASVPSH